MFLLFFSRGAVLAAMEGLLQAMETSLNYCLNKLHLHPHARASAPVPLGWHD